MKGPARGAQLWSGRYFANSIMKNTPMTSQTLLNSASLERKLKGNTLANPRLEIRRKIISAQVS